MVTGAGADSALVDTDGGMMTGIVVVSSWIEGIEANCLNFNSAKPLVIEFLIGFSKFIADKLIFRLLVIECLHQVLTELE